MEDLLPQPAVSYLGRHIPHATGNNTTGNDNDNHSYPTGSFRNENGVCSGTGLGSGVGTRGEVELQKINVNIDARSKTKSKDDIKDGTSEFQSHSIDGTNRDLKNRKDVVLMNQTYRSSQCDSDSINSDNSKSNSNTIDTTTTCNYNNNDNNNNNNNNDDDLREIANKILGIDFDIINQTTAAARLLRNAFGDPGSDNRYDPPLGIWEKGNFKSVGRLIFNVFFILVLVLVVVRVLEFFISIHTFI